MQPGIAGQVGERAFAADQRPLGLGQVGHVGQQLIVHLLQFPLVVGRVLPVVGGVRRIQCRKRLCHVLHIGLHVDRAHPGMGIG